MFESYLQFWFVLIKSFLLLLRFHLSGVATLLFIQITLDVL